MTKYQYKKLTQDNVVMLTVTPKPDWQDFGEFVAQFISQENGKIIEQDCGMDRHQVRYDVAGERLILQYEHYTDSIWIEQEHV
ncbi:MAG: DUF3630 family protein [Gammaproteobacteria bacterium]|nr:DUF3630 family protein [Gammaproteobacteria bacterium]